MGFSSHWRNNRSYIFHWIWGGGGGIQGSIDRNLNDTTGFKAIAKPNVMMKFYDDNSGPSVYEYHGDEWTKWLPQFSSYWGPPDKTLEDGIWKKIKIRIPMRNEIFIEDIFNSQLLNDHLGNLHPNFLNDHLRQQRINDGIATKKRYIDRCCFVPQRTSFA